MKINSMAALFFSVLALDSVIAAEPKTDIHGDPLPTGAIARLGSSRLRGNRLMFTPDSKRVVRELPGGDLQFYEVPTGKPSVRIRAADVPERNHIIGYSVGFSPDSKLMAAVLWEGRTGIWETDTGKLVRWIESGRFYSVVDSVFSPDGKHLAVGGSEEDGKGFEEDKISVGLYEVATGKQLFTVRGTNGQFTDDGKQLIAWQSYTATKPKIRIVSLADPEQRSEFDHTTNVPNSEDPRSDGKSFLFELDKRGTVALRDLKTGEFVRALAGAKAGERGGVNLRIAPGRRELIVTQVEPPMLFCWNLDDGTEIWKREMPSAPNRADLSKDGKTLVTPGKEGEILIVDARTGKDRATIPVAKVGHIRTGSKISPDGKAIATFTASPEPGGGSLLFWDATTGAKLTDLPGHSALIVDALFSPDGSKILTASRDDTLRTWDSSTGRELSKLALTGVDRMALSPDGTKLYASDAKEGSIRVVDAATGKIEKTFSAFKKPLVGFALTGDGKRLIAAGRDADEAGSIRILNAANGERISSFSAGESRIEQFVASSDGTRFAATVEGRRLIVWNNDGEVLSETKGIGKREPSWKEKPPHHLIGSVAFAPDHSRIAFSDQEAGIAVLEGSAQILLGRAKQTGVYFQNGAARNDVRDLLAFAPDGKTLAWSGIESTPDIFLIEARTLSIRRKLAGDSYPVKRLAYSPDGAKLFSTGPDGSALVWDLFDRSAPKSTDKPNDKDIAKWWETLAIEDSASADPAMRSLTAHPLAAVAWLSEKLLAPTVEPGVIDALIAQLGDRDFAKREAASKKLAQIGTALDQLTAAAEKSESSEIQRRAEILADRLRRTGPIQRERSVEILERIGSSEAKKLLEKLAKEASTPRLKLDAAEALKRTK